MLKNKRNSKPKIRWGLKKICLGLLNITLPPRQARSWIEANFHKRECIKFIPSNSTAFDEPLQCCCGQERALHPIVPGTEIGSPNDKWVPNKHTRSHPTDAYGTIEFQGGAHPTKAQYVRLSYDTRPELLVQLFTREWNLELPKLLISVQGGKANFDLQPKLKKVLRKGLLRAAKTTGAWIFTGGTNTGVTKQVGDALMLEGHGSGRVVSIGIAPWGIIERNHELLGHNREVSCHSISTPRSKLAVLNNRHAYFLLVDNGTQGKYGAELILRRKLEKYLSNQQLQLPFTLSSSGPTVCKCTPVVCLVIEGGTNTIRAVLEYVTDNPPVPVVVCDGSGRAADLIAFVHRHEHNVLDTMKVEVCEKIKNTFEVSQEKAECLFVELLQCTLNKKLITVFCIQDGPEGKAQELDQTILTALFKSQSLKPAEQLSLVLTWNRVDIARSEIFVYGQEWPSGALDEAMMQALEHDRIDFVRLLLENGVSMKKFLTIPRLEELYNSKHGPANTLGYILRDIRTHIPKGYVYTLHDIGLVINKLMGGAYRSYYTRRKFRPIYAKVMNIYNTHNPHRKQSSVQRTASAANSMGMGLAAGLLPFTSEMALFEFPFNELLIWAVLTKRQQMAMLMWTHGEEALAKSLVACKLYKAMAHEAADDDLDTEIYEELRSYAKEFEQRGLKLLDFCYRQDADKTQRLLTCELHSWSSQSCLSLAVAANHRPLLAHPCSQIILADLWMGALRTRKNTNLKVILGLLFPPFIKKLDFKSKEELQSMPQTEEEHLENRNLDYEEEKKLPDAESPFDRCVIKEKNGNEFPVKALIPETFLYRNTKVQENGKVSLSDSDLSPFKGYYDNGFRQHRPLKLKKKFYEFYTAPITKFWADSMAYVLFLVLFSYTVLVKMQPTPSWQEFYSIAYITTLGCEKIREIVSSEPVAISHKFSVWAWNMWNPCDGAAIIFFIIGLGFRLKPNTMDVGRVIYCIDSMYWYLRILNILGVNKYLGPLVTMMGKMVKNMIYFVVLLLVVLMSFGVCRQAILFPNSEASWRLIREVYFQPYFMLYGEVFADDIDPPCGDDPAQSPCITGHWVTPIAMSMYLLIANILLINLLIAVFNNIFNEVNSVSHQVWMFQRFTVVMEYQQKPVLPPPMIAFCHCYSLLKYLIRKYKGLENVRDNGLKLFLEKEDMECLYDFEEECVEGYFKEQEVILLQSTEERIKNTDERVEHMSQRIEDINQKENKQTASVKDIALKIQKLEDATAQILDHLAVIHRFMATHTNMQDHFPGGSLINIGTAGSGVGGGGLMLEPRFRTVSETGTSSALQLPTRRKYNRSMSEMRPDTGPYDEPVSHLEVQTVLEENEYHKSPERERKFSVQSADDMDYIVMSPAGEANKKVSTPPVFKSSNSGESKDTLTPVDNSDAKTLVGEEEGSMEDFVDLNYEGLRQRAIRKRMGTGRRNSETLYDIRTSQSSLNQMIPMARRQQSLTQSEPDSGNEQPAIKPKVVNKRRQMLLQIHDEYTSITDELETACQMISSPTASLAEERQKTELTNPEFVALLEKQHLKECEENDYFILERLIQSRSSIEESYENTYGGIAIDFSHRRGLHRETAVELPITPSKSNTTVGDNNETTDFGVTNESQFRRHLSSERKISPGSNHNSPRNSQLYSQSSYLNPGPDLKSRLYKKSCESLQKNSSTETEYSLQRPYHVIKQSSNETNTSFNSSFNIENSSSFNNELSLDGDPTSMNATVIENVADDSRKTGPHLKKMPGVELGPANRLAAPESGDIAKLHKESTSSTSTEEARDERFLPKFTTNTVQDEIAKLSSTIKSSTEDEKAETPVNETMC